MRRLGYVAPGGTGRGARAEFRQRVRRSENGLVITVPRPYGADWYGNDYFPNYPPPAGGPDQQPEPKPTVQSILRSPPPPWRPSGVVEMVRVENTPHLSIEDEVRVSMEGREKLGQVGTTIEQGADLAINLSATVVSFVAAAHTKAELNKLAWVVGIVSGLRFINTVMEITK